MKNNVKRVLYESIMKDVAKTVKRHLNEEEVSYGKNGLEPEEQKRRSKSELNRNLKELFKDSYEDGTLSKNDYRLLNALSSLALLIINHKNSDKAIEYLANNSKEDLNHALGKDKKIDRNGSEFKNLLDFANLKDLTVFGIR